MRRPARFLAALLVLAACAPPPPPASVASGPDRRAVAQAIAAAADQVRRCYRPPRVSGVARSITTRLRVRFAPDGTLSALPELIEQVGVTPDTRVDAGRLAEAARLAVIRCLPLRLPPEIHRGGWEDFELTFSRRAVA